MSTHTSRKRGPPHIVIPDALQVPTLVKVSEQHQPTTKVLSAGGISRAQVKEPVHSQSPGGSPVPLPASRTIDHFRAPAHAASSTSGTQYTMTPVQPPSGWDASLTGFLARFCSTHPFGLESLSVWHEEMSNIKIPTMQTKEQWAEVDGYTRYLAYQLAANNALTGNLNWAIFHFLVNMRCLRTVDFLSDIDPVLRNLQFVLRISLRALCLSLDGSRLRKVLADRPISSGMIDLITDKYSALEGGEVRSHAFKQTLADPSKLYQQLLHYIFLAISKLDIRNSQSSYMFYQELLVMLLEMFSSQIHAHTIESSTNVYIDELLENVGPSTAFNVDRTPAQEVVETLLLNAAEAPALPSGQGLVQSAYSYFFSRQSQSAQTKQLEQRSLMLLLLLVSQPSPAGCPTNPFLAALERVQDTPEHTIKLDNRVSFRKLLDRILGEANHIEWAALLQILVSRNEAFRTYVLARTDPDAFIIPLLKRISLATALPIPSASSSHSAHSHKREESFTGPLNPSVGGNAGSNGSLGGKPGDRFAGSIFSSPKMKSASSSPAFLTFASDAVPKEAQHRNQQQPQKQPWGPLTPPIRGSSNSKALSVKMPSSPLHTTTTIITAPASASASASVSSPLARPASATVPANTAAPSVHQQNTTPTAAAAAVTSPIAKLRYNVAQHSTLSTDTVPYVHLYCWMDTLLCLSEDAQFVEQMQRTTIESWTSAKYPMYKQPLSLCIVVEAMRIFQLNIMLLKDAHVHKLSLGILANILNESTLITTAISQKLVKLFEMIHRRYSKLASAAELAWEESEERSVYEETITVLLALFCRLVNTNNPQFIYCLLQAREILGAFRRPSAKGGREEESKDSAVDVAAAGYSAELRVRIAYFHAQLSTLTNPQAKDIMNVIESIAGPAGKPSSASDGEARARRVSFGSRIAPDSKWTGFMLPLVWELLASSVVAVEGGTPLLEEFENLVL